MLQTILLTALSSQLTFLKPTFPQKPLTPPVVFTRVLPQENYVSYVAEKKNTILVEKTQKATVLPTIQPIVVPTVPPVIQPTVEAAKIPSTISDEAINYLGNCEAGMNPARNSGNGYYGAFQFSYGTWKSLNTGYERADLAPLEVQKAAVKQLLQRSSIFNQFPACARRMSSIGLI